VNFGGITLTSASNAPYVTDVFVAKLDPAGNYLWAVRGGGSGSDTGQDIAVDATGNAYITGDFTGSATFVPGTSLTSTGSRGVFVAKLSPTGQWLWATQAGSSVAGIKSIALDGSGNAYLSGIIFGSSTVFGNITLSSAGGVDAFVAKLDPAGTCLWARNAGGSSDDRGNDLAVDAAGNATLTGYFSSDSVAFGSITLNNPSPRSWQLFVARLNSSGSWQWASGAYGTNSTIGRSVGLDANGNAYVTGSFDSPVTFGSTTLAYMGSIDIFVGKLGPTGTWLWAQRAGGVNIEYSYGLAVDGPGNAYIVGGFLGLDTAFGSTALPYSLSDDAFIAKLNPAGQWQWAERMEGNSGADAAYSVALSPTAEPFVAGTTGSASMTIGCVTLYNFTSTMGFVARMGANATATTRPRMSELSLWPNPAREAVRLTLEAATSARLLLLLDATGRVLRRQELAAGATQAAFSVAGLAPGMYLLRCGSSAQRFVVE